jgi:hypothetical protein
VGDIPYITRSDCDNGISLFVSDTQLDKYSMDLSGVITIGLDTQTVFFQPHAFFTGQNIQVLNHASLNRWTGFFLLPLLKIQMEKFNWGGNGATLGRLKKTRIMLPVDKKGSSDYKYMAQYTINLEIKKREQYINHVEEKI